MIYLSANINYTELESLFWTYLILVLFPFFLFEFVIYSSIKVIEDGDWIKAPRMTNSDGADDSDVVLVRRSPSPDSAVMVEYRRSSANIDPTGVLATFTYHPSSSPSLPPPPPTSSPSVYPNPSPTPVGSSPTQAHSAYRSWAGGFGGASAHPTSSRTQPHSHASKNPLQVGCVTSYLNKQTNLRTNRKSTRSEQLVS